MKSMMTLIALGLFSLSAQTSRAHVSINNARAKALLAQALRAPTIPFQQAIGLYRGYCLSVQQDQAHAVKQSSILYVSGDQGPQRNANGIAQLVDQVGLPGGHGDTKYDFYTKRMIEDDELLRVLLFELDLRTQTYAVAQDSSHVGVLKSNRGHDSFANDLQSTLSITQKDSKLFTTKRTWVEGQTATLSDVCVYDLVATYPSLRGPHTIEGAR